MVRRLLSWDPELVGDGVRVSPGCGLLEQILKEPQGQGCLSEHSSHPDCCQFWGLQRKSPSWVSCSWVNEYIEMEAGVSGEAPESQKHFESER